VAGDLFVALRGDNFDGHDFLAQAAAKKVCGLVVEKFDASIPLPQLIVNNSLQALGQIAALNRAAFTKPVLAITGSSGKTTVKTMLASILAECGSVHATKGNLNNHIGVPLTLLHINAEHDFAVIEMGASAIGEIAYLCSLAKPHIAMVNNVMPAHIEGFGSIEGVAQAKGEIYEALSSKNTAVINLDDDFAAQYLAKVKSNIMQVSLRNTAADCYADKIHYAQDSVSFDLHIYCEKTLVNLNAQGEHSVRNALMAAAMAYGVGANLNNIQSGLAKFSPVGGRMSRHQGVNGSLIIDDSYNANPGSVRAAIDVLCECAGQRILVLGDLAELGDHAADLHAQLGLYAKHKNIEHFFTLGVLTQYASEAFGEQNGQHHFFERDQLSLKLKELVAADTTILIKGSRSAKMDLVVRDLGANGDAH
jgi:UDP-N-acetylmuramoyl-tripeptide--D-alanyl-D-alanine ligase